MPNGSLSLANPARDATALTLVEVLPGTASALPVYRPCLRRQWIGVSYGRAAAADRARWRSTGRCRRWWWMPPGWAQGWLRMLEHALPGLVTPFTFNAASKSRLGWDFLGLVDAGRWQEALYRNGRSGRTGTLAA